MYNESVGLVLGSSQKKVKIHNKFHVYLAFKRLFDIIISGLGLIFLSPIFLIIAILIKLEDGRNVFIVMKRIGKDGKEFNFYKFQSMYKNAEEILPELLKDPKIAEEYKKNKKIPNDPRVTKVGKFLRKTSLDELPQLINVFKGDMTLIGNRPYLLREKKDMGFYYNEIIKTKPGITGFWQVSGRSNTTFDKRLELEKYYSNNYNFKLDAKIFFKTFKVVLFGKVQNKST